MRQKKIKIQRGLLLGILLVSSALQAEPFIVETARVETRALEYNPMVRAMIERAAGKKTRGLEVMTPNNPMLMIGGAGQSGLLDTGSRSATNFMWDQKWRFPGKSLMDLAVIHADNRAADTLVNLAKRKALWLARMGYWDYWENQRAWELRRKAEKQWKFFNDLIISKGLAGQWLSMKVIRVQLGISRDANDYITAGQALDTSKANLKHVLGLSRDTTFKLGKEEKVRVFREKLNLSQEQAEKNNPEVQLAREKLDTALAKRRAERMDFLPDLTTRLKTTGSPTLNGTRQYGVRLGLSIPLGIAQGAQVVQASREVAAAEFELQSVKDKVGHLLEDAFVKAEAAWRLLKLYNQGGLLKQIEMGWNFSKGAWENEKFKLADYIESYDIYQDTELAYIKARANYGKTIASLEYQKGVFEIKE